METLYEKTLKLLRDSPIDRKQIAKDNEVSLRWVYRLENGDYTDPGVNRIERLYRYLNRRRRRA